MISVAKHLRIVRSTVSDQDVEKRASAVSALAAAFNKTKDPGTLLRIGNDVAQGLLGCEMTPAFSDQIEAAIQKSSKSFLSSEQPLETAVVGALALHEALAGQHQTTQTWSIKDVIAAGGWLALAMLPSFAEAKLEDLRTELLERTRSWVLRAAELSRTRVAVPDLVAPTAEEAQQPEPVAAALKRAIDAIDKLRSNAAIDREETDLLWLALGGQSRILRRPLASLSAPTRAVVAAFEVSATLRRLPGQAHRELVLKDIPAGDDLNLHSLMTAIGDDRASLAAGTMASGIASLPRVFLLLNALSGTVADDEAGQTPHSIEDWGARALMEAAVSRMWSGGSTKL
jgi:hypothetical protein